MRSVFRKLSKPELDFLTANCNFSDEEISVLRMASVGKPDIYIADKLSVSDTTVTRIKKKIKEKIQNFIKLSNRLYPGEDVRTVCEVISEKLEIKGV